LLGASWVESSANDQVLAATTPRDQFQRNLDRGRNGCHKLQLPGDQSGLWNGVARAMNPIPAHAYFCATGGKPPFYGNCIYGANNELRGYVADKYFDRYLVATQFEYRLALPMRFGVVAFGGVGEAFPGGDQLLFTNNSFLPGGGPRFPLSKQYHVNLRADIAWGKDGHTFSLGLGDAFH
jgi:hypothetical protein